MENPGKLSKIGLGGGCHWCTEALYQSLRGVLKVEQGFIASINDESTPSEAVVVHFNPGIISLKTLIEIHLHTHDSTSDQSMREKYRSAIYAYSNLQLKQVESIVSKLQADFSKSTITKILKFSNFRLSMKKFQNYYYSNPDKPFCRNYIHPKLQLLQKNFSTAIDSGKIHTAIN